MKKMLLLCMLLLLGSSSLRAGDAWRALDNKVYESALMSSIVVHPQTGNLIITTINKGMYRSTDNGESWHQVFATDSTMSCIAVRADGTIFAGGVRGYVFSSSDGGATWTRNKINTEYPVSSFAFLPGGKIMAGTGTVEDREGIAYDIGDGVFVSSDNGATWAKKNNGIAGILCVTAFAVDVTEAARVWCATSNWRTVGTQGGLYYSDDDGDSWHFQRIVIDGKGAIPDSMNVRGIEALKIDNTGRMFISMRGVALTTSPSSVACEFVAATSDLSKPWEILSVVPSSMFWMKMPLYSLHISNNGTMWGSIIGATKGGAHVSTDNGQHWEHRRSGIIPAISGRYETMHFAEQQNGTVYAIQWLDNHVYRLEAPTDVPTENQPTSTLVVAPNPVGETSSISFVLPRAAAVRLVAVDMLGREIAVLAEGYMEAGSHRTLWNAAAIGTGAYSIVLRANGEIVAQKTAYKID